jgi:hypothetical protein
VPSQPFPAYSRSTRSSQSTPTYTYLDPPDSHTSKSAAKRESCRNTSNYRTQPGKGQCNPELRWSSLPKYGALLRKSPVFQTPTPQVIEFGRKIVGIIWRLDCSLPLSNTLTEARRVSLVCHWPEMKLHPIDDVAHQPGVLLPSAEAFQEASDWPSSVRAASTKRPFLPHKFSPSNVVTGKS